jgi:putative membrane protein
VTRGGLLLAGGAALALAAWSPLPALLTPGPFAAHMAGHMLLVAAVAPLLAAGLARAAPAAVAAFAGRCPPVAASAVELVLVWGWHAPALHRAARGGGLALAAEQGSFLLAGLALWAGCLARAPDGRLARGPEGVFALLLTATHMTLLGVLLALSPRPLLGHHGHGAAAAPLADQELGGVVMLVAGGAAYLAGGLALLAELLAAPPPPRRRSPPERKPCASA